MRCTSLSLALAAMLLATSAVAGERTPPPPLQDPVFATRVDSMIEVGPDGRILRYEPITELKEPLATRVRTLADSLRFEPVLEDGRPVIARTRMRMHLVAEPMGDGQLKVHMEHVGFPDGEEDARGASLAPDSYVRGVAKRMPITYPAAALRAGVSGRVLVALRLEPDGSVADAVVRESALFSVKGRERVLGPALAVLERGATEAIRRWRFDVRVPEGAYPKPADLTGLINVEYLVDDHPKPRPGLWLHETRSRERPLPWLDPMLAERLPDMADVGEAGHFGTAAPRLRLRAPAASDAL